MEEAGLERECPRERLCPMPLTQGPGRRGMVQVKGGGGGSNGRHRDHKPDGGGCTPSQTDKK